jgi:glycosyltransferase involved in cell wall biosynthesis
LLVLDDGSEDNTKEVVTKIIDPRIQYIQYDRIGITGILKNKGILLSKGDIIAFMDSDDLWLPTKLEKQMNLLSANQNIFFSFTNSYDFKGNKEIVNILNPQTSGEGIENVFMPCMKNEIRPPIQTFLFHKKCLEVCGGFSETRIFNDYEFIGNLIYCFDAAIVHEPLLLRRLHNTNSIDLYSDELAEEYVDAFYQYNLLERYYPEFLQSKWYGRNEHWKYWVFGNFNF